jgi:chemotaxis protein MotB
MALRRKRDSAMIWPGFVDAVTTLLMVLMFVLTIFTVMQSVLRDTITSQDTELDALTAQVAGLADALGLERRRADALQTEIGGLNSDLAAARAKADEQSELIATLNSTLAAKDAALTQAQGQITSFEAQLASLLAQRDDLLGQRDDLLGQRDAAQTEIGVLRAKQAQAMSEKQALDLALAQARAEVDAAAEAARLAAARREALEALLSDLRDEAGTVAVDDSEAARLADAAALAALRQRLQNADDEITAMTLNLEEQRKRAEETLTLLAAAASDAAKQPDEATRKAALMAAAEQALSAQQSRALAAERKLALLNQQITALRSQLGQLQSMLDISAAADADKKVQIEALGTQLNAALARVAGEQKRRAELEEAERKRLEAENQNLARFRSEFFGQLSALLAGREGVRVVGDRFVFSSEVLFNAGSADLAPEGRAQIAGVVDILNDIANQIPPGIDWIIRVDGHTDNVPLGGGGQFADNWQLSQARALSVVRYMQNDLGFDPMRMAAAGFGEYRPVADSATPEGRAQNRRIELKLTER